MTYKDKASYDLYTYKHTCGYQCVYMYMYICVYVYVFVCVCVCIYMHTCVYVDTNVRVIGAIMLKYIYASVCVRVSCKHTYISQSVCIHIMLKCFSFQEFMQYVYIFICSCLWMYQIWESQICVDICMNILMYVSRMDVAILLNTYTCECKYSKLPKTRIKTHKQTKRTKKHTHTNTHTQIHTQTHTHTHTHTNTRTHKHTQTHAHAYTHVCI